MGVVKMAVIVGGAAMLFAYGANLDKKETEAAVSKYKLTKYETGFMKQCKSSMGSYRISFAKGAKKTEGCACVTSKLSKRLPQKKLEAAGKLLNATFYMAHNRKKKNVRTKTIKKFDAIQRTYRLSERDFGSMLRLITSSVKTCGQRA